MSVELQCPTCKGRLRPRTFEEVTAELVQTGVPEALAPLVVPARTGPYGTWWCDACGREWSAYALLYQCMRVTETG